MTAASSPTSRVGRDLSVEERRLQVLRAAARCLAKDGYEAVRLRDIATAAGVTTGALQHYWVSREELLEQAFEQVSIDLLDRWAAATQSVDHPWEQIVVLVDQLATAPDVRQHCSLWTEYAATAGRRAFLRQGFRTIYDAWRELLTRAVHQGVVDGCFKPTLATDDIVTILLTHMDGCELAIAADIDAMTPVELRRLTLDLAAYLLRFDVVQAQNNPTLS
ncbi:MAG TPA: TetR family transcriptional regulator [Actinomycetes bacterium]|nr:TetR family transcriptional regulator [Actinomycetes bacterium]